MTSTKQTSSRLASVDVLKGMVMFFIVVVHVFFLMPTTGGSPRDVSIAMQIMYLGLMVFFIISGYFYRPGRTPAENIKKRIVQMIIPLVIGLTVLPTILYFYLIALGQSPELNDLLSMYKAIFGGVHLFEPISDLSPTNFGLIWIYSGFYFLQIMPIAFIIFYTVVEFVRDDVRKTFAVIAALVIVQALMIGFVDLVLPFWLNLVPISAAFMFVGEFLARKNILEWLESCPVKESRYWIYLLVAIVVAIGVSFLFPPGSKFDVYSFGNHGGWSVFTYFIEACAACYVYLALAGLFTKIPLIPRLLSAVGRHTIAILCLHLFVIKILVAPFHPLVTNGVLPRMPMSEAAVFMLVTLAIIILAAEYLPAMIKNRMSGKH